MRKSAIFLAIVILLGAAWWWHYHWQHGEPPVIETSVELTDDFQPPRAMDIAMIQAAYRADETSVAELLESGASAKARFGEGGHDYFRCFGGEDWTALLALAHSDTTVDRVAIARLLLDAGADINADDGYGDTALAQCCYMNHTSSHESLALFLLERGANPNTRTGVYIDGAGGIAPVHRAVNNLNILRALIQHHADVNVMDSDGRSPLNWVASYAMPESTPMLIEAGADDGIALRKGKYGSSRPLRIVEMLLPANYPLDHLQPVIDHLKGRREVLAAWILGSPDAAGGDEKLYVIYLLHAAKDPQKLEESVTTFCHGKSVKFDVALLDPSRWASVRLMRSGVPFYAAEGYKDPTASE